MYLAERIVLSKSTHLEIYALADRNACLAKQLYNAALFRLRQTFTGWEKESQTDNEKEVFRELSQLKQAYPSLSINRVLSCVLPMIRISFLGFPCRQPRPS